METVGRKYDRLSVRGMYGVIREILDGTNNCQRVVNETPAEDGTGYILDCALGRQKKLTVNMDEEHNCVQLTIQYNHDKVFKSTTMTFLDGIYEAELRFEVTNALSNN